MKMTGRVFIKKYIVIFAVILAAAFLPVTVYAAEASVTFGSERYGKDNGEQFHVGVYLNGDGTIAEYHVELKYDSLRLKYISGADEADEENGVLLFDGSASAEQVKLWLTFEAVSGGEARLAVDTAVAAAPDGSSFSMTTLQEVSVYIAGEDTAAETEAVREAVNADPDRIPESSAGNGAADGGTGTGDGAADGEPGTGDGAAAGGSVSGDGTVAGEPGTSDGAAAGGSVSGDGTVAGEPGTGDGAAASGSGDGAAGETEPDSGKAGISGEQGSAAAAGSFGVSVGQAGEGDNTPGSKANVLRIVIVAGIALICVTGLFITVTCLYGKKTGNKGRRAFLDDEAVSRRRHRNREYDRDEDYDDGTEYGRDAEYDTNVGYGGDAGYDTYTEYGRDMYDAEAEYAGNVGYDADAEYDRNTEYGENAECDEHIENSGRLGFNGNMELNSDKRAEANEVSHTVTEEEKELPIIKVDNVTMKFKVATSSTSGLKDYVIQKLKKQITTRDLLALDNVSFEVFKGEVVGIIGTNGSGKSTLLKIISGAMKPTGGRVIVDKSKIQLLTLGTGFDMELSARENVYLNGAIIGYSREFLDKHYDEIVAFAELEGFMDTKVKNFSSGMVSRLGFAIATAGDAAEILILDEVLSVGDEFFRKKSLKRIKEMIHGGSTVIMVSHGMGTIRENCTKVVWIEKGVLQMAGDAGTVCTAYQRMERTVAVNS